MSEGTSWDPQATLVGDGGEDSGRATQLAPGDRVDRYVVAGLIGAGAMGIVYRAHDPSLDRVVALKLLHPAKGIDRKRSERLMSEAQALAKLSGPNVVNVYDVGTEGDEVYVAMELVEGVTLSQWLAAEPRRPAEVIDVFMQAGRGLAAAHAAGLVHGDFKPANVMVDDRGRAKVLDFGLAHQADAVASRDSSLETNGLEAKTSGPRLVGTPAFMAPEVFAGDPGTASSDQFSYCVAMWTALHGEPPFVGRSVFELSAAVLGGELANPESRRGVPRWLQRALVRGLSTEPAERWPSMDELVGQLEANRPGGRRTLAAVGVLAIAASGWMWSRAQPGEVARCQRAAAAIAESGAVAREALQRAILASNEPYAEKAASKVDERVQQYVDEWNEAYISTCTAPREVMPDATRELAYRCLASRRARVRATVAALADQGERAAEVGVEVAGELPPIVHCTDAAYLHTLRADPTDAAANDEVVAERNHLATSRVLRRVGRYQDAYELAEATLRRADALGFAPLRCEVRVELAAGLDALGRYAEAIEHLRTAYELAVSADVVGAAVTTSVRLISMQVTNGDLEQAREWAFHARAHVGREQVPERMWADYKTAVGQLEATDMKFDVAIEHIEAAVESFERIYGSDHWETAARKSILAAHVGREGDRERSRTLLGEALAVLSDTLGREHPRVGLVENNLGLTLMRLGETGEAITHLTHALGVLQRTLPDEHPNIAYALTNLSTLHLDEGDLPKAHDYCQAALAQREGSLIPTHAHIGYTLVDCGEIERRMGRYPEALASFRRALQIASEQGDPRHAGLTGSLVGQGRTMIDMGDPAGAVAPLERAVDLFRRPASEYGGGERSIAEITLAQALWEEPTTRARAITLARGALAVLEALDASSHGVLARDLVDWRAWADRVL